MMNLIVLGSMKSGTTSLHNYLNLHPDVSMSAEKEPNYFVEELNFNKGIKWYESLVNQDRKIRGESSQSYSKRHLYDGIPQRIKKYNSKMKFLYIVRNPIDRIISHHIEYLSMGHNQVDLNQALLENTNSHHYILTSSYAYQIKPFLEEFELSHFHFLTMEDLNKYPLNEMNKIFKFLGISQLTNENSFINQYNSTETKRVKSKFGSRVTNSRISPLIKSFVPLSLMNKMVRTNSYYKKLFYKPAIKPTINENIKNKLEEIFIPEMKEFEEISRLNLTYFK